MSKIASIIIVLSCLGCATSYKSGSYQSKIQDNLFEIGFSGNAFTDKRFVKRAFLRKSAEIALKNNMRYFVVKNSVDDSTTTYLSDSETSVRNGRLRTSASATPITKPGISGVIQLVESNCESCYDATQVLANTTDLVN